MKGRNLKQTPHKKKFRLFFSFLIHRLEISKILKSSYLRGLNMASFFVASKIIIFITVCVFVLTGNQLTASNVFMAISLYGAVRLTITLFFPFAIEKLSECLISIRRIQVGALRSALLASTSQSASAAVTRISQTLPRTSCSWMKLLLRSEVCDL